ncbi:TIM-barrel domain-containing protein [Paenibacillus sp. M1]|uniref:TIM-barrel domain-containing protein n=1 Tax=Paenibacillus haidiansis TaxID=1574488 RepID=A0ABU7VQJ8_9BACL
MLTSEMIRPDGELMQRSDRKVEPFGPFLGAHAESGRCVIEGRNGSLLIQWIYEDIIRITGAAAKEALSGPLPAYAAMLSDNGDIPILVQESDETIFLSGGGNRTVEIDKLDLSFRVTDAAGKPMGNRHVYYGGEAHLQCRGEMTGAAQIYGLGETTGFLNKRGERYTMWNSDVYSPHVADMESLYQSIPVLVHHDRGQAYALFIDNPGKIQFDMRKDQDHYLIDLETGLLDAYFVAGPTLKDVVRNYTLLTGRMDMPPLWAIGYQQSRYSYMNQEEVLELARTFRAKGIPCDAIYLDIHYMEEFKVFTFDRQQFPDPKRMIAELKEMGIRIVPIVDPGVKIDERFPVYVDGAEKGLFCVKADGSHFHGEVWPGMSVFPDFSDPEAAKWWGDLHRDYAEMGIAGIWNDMNEPSVFACETHTMDLDVVHRNDGRPITHEAWHNMYGLGMSKATYEGMQRLLNGERPFVLTRAGYAGIQRFAAVWTGDNRSFWEHMAMFMPMSMNLGFSGIAFCGSDIGGFEHSASGELLARWTQMGAFSPLCRNHSAHKTLYQEPWRFGAEVEDICREYISLRYRLLPYLYAYFREATLTGLPILRSLALEYPDDPETYLLSDQFLFGRDLLIAPIYRPGTAHRVVYLPQGVWYDYWTGERHEGGRHIMVHAPLDTLPIFVRGGAVIPETGRAQHTTDAGWSDLTLNYYSLGQSLRESVKNEFQLYEDDGVSENYKQGSYNELRCFAEESEDSLHFGFEELYRGYERSREHVRVVIKHLGTEPKEVSGLKQAASAAELEGMDGWFYDSGRQELILKISQDKAWECAIIK